MYKYNEYTLTIFLTMYIYYFLNLCLFLQGNYMSLNVSPGYFCFYVSEDIKKNSPNDLR